ncbi:peptidase S9, prolyl oligopeptidase active site region [Salinisphaera sp. PC39]|uniref:S9 family peptidase n=1 Tax=Salinisphaera sp. PC39 TaxID=1304156 RepID=UPI00333FBFAD
MTRTRPYGTWPSPVDPDALAGAGRKLGQVALDGGDLYWLEGRPAEGGRSTVACPDGDGGATDLLPGRDVRSTVHEYGGGAFAAADGRLWFVDAADQAIRRRERDGRILDVTGARPGVAFADLQVDRARERLFAVREDAGGEGEPRASLVSIAADGVVREIHGGRDFYASPRLSPAGDRLVWLAWDHPDMPWDATELWQVALDADGDHDKPRRIAGGPGESLFAPVFAPDGGLHVVSDRDGWWNIQRVEGDSLVPVTRETTEFGLPQWVFGQSTYAFDDDGTLFALMTRDGRWSLVRVDRASGALATFDLPFTQFDQLRVGSGRLAFIGASPSEAPTLCTLAADGTDLQRLRASTDRSLPAAAVSTPESLSYPTADGDTAHALYYPPRSADYAGPADERPPLLIKCHGGPTGATGTALDPRIQFWTSRGFAVLDVNYRGSTGYGRAYRQKLYGAWGVADVADCVHGARHLAARGDIDPDRVVISGSSAGGYTVLCVLAFTDLAAAGASYYGIGDLERLMASTHKFESRYLRRLIGDDPDLLRERSPLNHADRVSCPVLFLQGEKDKVVPPDQAEAMAGALRERGVPVAHIAFPGERHGFRDAANVRTAIASELAFYGRVLGFEPADDPPPLEVDNLDR